LFQRVGFGWRVSLFTHALKVKSGVNSTGLRSFVERAVFRLVVSATEEPQGAHMATVRDPGAALKRSCDDPACRAEGGEHKSRLRDFSPTIVLH